MDFIKKHWIHRSAIVIFLLSTMIIFFPSFQGQKLEAGDFTQWWGMAQESRDFKEKTGENTLWTGSMFSGMPNYYIDFQQTKDPIDYIAKVLRAGFDSEVGKFMSGLLAFYFLLIMLGVNPWLSIIGSLVFVYSTNNLVLLNAGHFTKISTIMTAPYIIAGVLLAYRRNMLLGALIFLIGMSLNLKANHPQMTYYLGLVMGLFVVSELVAAIKEKKMTQFAKVSGLLALAGLIAIGTTFNRTLPILEYSKDTMRGAPILQKSKSNDSSSKVDGLAWDYAMNWSNGTKDLLSSWIPLAVGGSSGEKISNDSNFAKALRKKGIPTRANLQAPLYWGSLPITSGPIYFGAVIFFLFFLAAFSVKGSIKWWVVAAVIMTFFLSMGKNFELFNKFFFNYVPLFNKFRTPNSVLSVTVIIIPLLATLGLQDFIKNKNISKSQFLIPGVGFIILTLLIGVLGPGIFDMSSPSDASLAQAEIDPNSIISDRASYLRSSSITSALLMTLTMGIMWLYARGKVKMVLLLSIIAVLSIGDLFFVNNRYISSDNYKSKRQFEANYTPRAVDTQILKDADLSYRVFDNTINTFNSSFSSYFHKTIGGYHAAKLQRYQDIIEYHISKSNMNVINMLNTKYFITGQQGQEEARLNSAAMGNAWFVNSVKFVPDADAEIEALNSFDPLGEAIVHEEFRNELSSTTFKKNGVIRMISYAPNRLVYESNTNSAQLAIFSEVWYGPNKGWKAYINGERVDHIRSNYVLRAMEVPAGQAEIIFEFDPDSNKRGKLISLICNLIFLIATCLYFWKTWKENKV